MSILSSIQCRHRGFEPQITEILFAENRKDARYYVPASLITNVVRDESPRWNTVLACLLILSEKLEEFGLIYYDTKVSYVEGIAMFNTI